jgi:hypothetical protein
MERLLAIKVRERAALAKEQIMLQDPQSFTIVGWVVCLHGRNYTANLYCFTNINIRSMIDNDIEYKELFNRVELTPKFASKNI